MIRFTTRHDNDPEGKARVTFSDARHYALIHHDEVWHIEGDFVEQLAAYEDLGMTPDQIRTALRVPRVYSGLEKITDHYKFEEQLEIFVEECSEAIKAVQKYKRSAGMEGGERIRRKMELVGEVADVLIMANQMQTYLGVRDVNAAIMAKIERQIKRIKIEQMETKYKVGDCVRVREWDDMAKENHIDRDGDIEFCSNGIHFVKAMAKYCGKVAKIIEVEKSKTFGVLYILDIDNDRFDFSDEMLEETWLERVEEE